MLKIVSDKLVLKSVRMETNESNVYTIYLSLKNLDDKIINQTFEYHNYTEAINDFLVLTNSIKGEL
jgi:hypothetical protein